MISEIVSPKRSEADRWVSAPERGTPASLGTIAWIAERVGRPLARLLLYPITIYFLITAHEARQASREFLKRARGGSVHWWNVLRHFYYFAGTILENSTGSASQSTGKKYCSAKTKTARAASC